MKNSELEERESLKVEKNSKHVDLDDILIELGKFGKYQFWNYLLICIPTLFYAASNIRYVFTAGEPTYRCYVPGCDNETSPEFNTSWLQRAIPNTSDITDVYIPDMCTMFSKNMTLTSCDLEDFYNTTRNCDKWVYDKSETTIVNKWDLTCGDNKWKLSLVGTAHFFGLLIGNVIFSFISDRFGRKIVLMISCFLSSFSGMLQIVAPNFYSFVLLQLISAMALGGVYLSSFILAVEMVSPSKREMSSCVINYFFAIGEALIGVLAWISGDWQIIQLVISAPILLCAILYWPVPESVRWLLTRREYEKVHKILNDAARMNGKVLPEQLFNELCNNCENTQENSKITFLQALKDIVKSKKLTLRYLNVFFNWAVNGFVFYGLSLNSTSLGGNKYVKFIAVCLAEIPGYTLAWYLLKKGRRSSLCGSLLLCAITCLAAAFVSQDNQWEVLLLFVIGKTGISSSFNIIYVYTAEIFATSIRTLSVGAGSVFARVGAMVAPFVPLLSSYYAPLPLMVFGIVSLIAALLTLLLPETLGTHLPDTTKQAENLKVSEENSERVALKPNAENIINR